METCGKTVFKVKDKDGKIWRLAERQYSSGGNDILKRALIDALIKGKYIDGYKKVGASCNEPNAFVDVDGNSLSSKRFTIDCDLGWDETLSYQDSFKWYDIDKRIADNYENGNLDLGTTEDCLDNSEREYDDYHGYYCEETSLVYVNGREYFCNTNDLSDFVWVESEYEYHHIEDVETCPECSSPNMLFKASETSGAGSADSNAGASTSFVNSDIFISRAVADSRVSAELVLIKAKVDSINSTKAFILVNSA